MNNAAAANASNCIDWNGYTCPQCGCWVGGNTYHVCWQRWSPFPQPFLATTGQAVQIGWTCPNCKTGVAPWMSYCTACAPKRPDGT